jgi:hypothetical protein
VTPRLRGLVGLMTTVLALVVGLTLWTEGRVWLGGVVSLAGLYRGSVAVRQLRAAWLSPE